MAAAIVDQREEFICIIDAYLRNVDLSTVSARNVRQHLEEAVCHDLTHLKDEIKQLITERFDEILAEREVSGNGVKAEDESAAKSASPAVSASGTSAKRGRKKKKVLEEEDAKYAAKLHEELNAGRPSRSAGAAAGGTGPKRKAVVKKKPVKRKKTGVDTDTGEDEAAEKKRRAVNRNNPFNAPMQLSQALSDLIGKTECSRPECVKSIWAYVKENGLQDPADKRYIICDESMKRVFNNAARVHMFTMNKVLSGHIFPIPKSEAPIDGSP